MTSQTTRTAASVLAEAAATAGFAPSLHNTQPWRWRVLPDAMELYAVPERNVRSVDPHGRLMTVSCGAALHHTVVALEATGHRATVSRFPDEDPLLLARITLGPRGTVTPAAMRRMQHLRTRRTDRRPTRDETVPAADLTAIQRAVEEHGVHLHLLVDDQVYALAAAAGRAAEVEARDPVVAHELEFWRARALPDTSLPETPVRSTVPNRDFGAHGRPIGEGHDSFARYGVLFGPDDEPESWLRAGEALSGAWLLAAERGVGVLPLSGVVEVDVTRAALRTALSELGHPYLVIRLGLPDHDHAGPPPTPRIPAEQLIALP